MQHLQENNPSSVKEQVKRKKKENKVLGWKRQNRKIQKWWWKLRGANKGKDKKK